MKSKNDREQIKIIRYLSVVLLFAASTQWASAQLIWDGDANRGLQFKHIGSNCASPGRVSAVNDSVHGKVWRYSKPGGSHRCESHGVEVGGHDYVFQNNTTYYLGWWAKLSNNENNNSNFQWKSYPNAQQNWPVVLKMVNGNMIMLQRQPDTFDHNGKRIKHVKTIWSMPFSSNQWRHIVLGLHLSDQLFGGWIELYIDGQKQTFIDGSQRYAARLFEPAGHVCPKWGVYGTTSRHVNFYAASMKIGSRYQDVSMDQQPPAPPCGNPTASAHDGNVPENVVDKNLSTRWSALGDNQWIQLCLGAEKKLTGVKVAFFKGNTRSAYFDVQASTDGQQWQTVVAGLSSSGTTNNLESFSFAPQTAKFVRLVGHGNSINMWNSFTEVEPIAEAISNPYLGSPLAIPGTLEAEHYDIGAFFDTDSVNRGGVFRNDAVDIESSTQNAYNIGWLEPGEWLEYSISVEQAATYKASALVAAEVAGGSFHLSIDGQTIGSYSAPATGGWQSWASVDQDVTLAAGVHILRITIDSGGFNLNAITFGPQSGPTNPGPVACSAVPWKKANLTYFESYPDPGSEECIKYNGCKWAGYFAGVDGKKTEAWVKAHNIAAVHSKHFNQYKHKSFLLRQGSKEIKVQVLDMCGDSDCNGCCTANLGTEGFLIDIEKYTMQRFGSGLGSVEWKVCN